MASPMPRPLRESISWVLRAVVVAAAAAVVVIDLYHWLSPSSVGVPMWAFPVIPLMVFAGPGALLILVAEAILTLLRRVRKTTLMLDAVLVAAWLVLWISHL